MYCVVDFRSECFLLFVYVCREIISDAFPLFICEFKLQLKDFVNVNVAYKYEFANKSDMKELYLENSAYSRDHGNRHMDCDMIQRAFDCRYKMRKNYLLVFIV